VTNRGKSSFCLTHGSKLRSSVGILKWVVSTTTASTTTSASAIAMKLIQISPRQLLCKDDTYRQNIRGHSVTLISLVIFFCLIMAFGIYSGLMQAAYGQTFWLVPMLLVAAVLYVRLPHYTATIDLDLECIKIKQYWPLLRKRRIQQYPIALIKTIEVRQKEDVYKVVWKQHDRSVVKFGDHYTEDRSRAETDAEQIRSFLNQDERDIEISFFSPAWSWSCFISSD
jgi:hypothetical protein